MEWLWLVSVGSTDVQVSLYGQSADGEWAASGRLELSKGTQSVREQHDGLMDLACIENALQFPDVYGNRLQALSAGRRQDAAPTLRFERGAEGAGPICELDAPPPATWRLAPDRDQLTFPGDALGLLCPKTQPLFADLREELQRLGLQADRGMVITLNTCRENDDREPVAAGPLVSRFIAERLGLHWHAEPLRPGDLSAGMAGWINLLVGKETYESCPSMVVERIMGVLNAAARSKEPPKRIFLTPGGGLPKLKPLYPVLAARRFGHGRVMVLEEPERWDDNRARLRPFSSGLLERQHLQFQAVEQLGRGRISAAYGVACAALAEDPDLPWARRMQALGAILNCLPEPAPPAEGRPLDEYWPEVAPEAQLALQVEAALAEGNLPAAILRLAALTESLVRSAVSKYMETNRARSRDSRHYSFPTAAARDSFLGQHPGMAESPGKAARDATKVRININAQSIASWAEKLEDSPLIELVSAYGAYSNVRNDIAHGNRRPPGDVLPRMIRQGLFNGLERPFGQNFLATQLFSAVAETRSHQFSGLREFRDRIAQFLEELRSSS